MVNWGEQQYPSEERVPDSGYVPSGVEVTVDHSWEQWPPGSYGGDYTIKVQAIDEAGHKSDWGRLTVTMPKNKLAINPLFLRFLSLLRSQLEK